MATKLNERAMLVGLHFSHWSAVRTDQKVTREVVLSHKTTRKAGHWKKRLVAAICPEYENLFAVIREWRAEHNTWTLPWSEDAVRVILAENWFDYSEVMRGHRAMFDTAVATFVKAFPEIKERARKELNGMFDDADYPSNIASRFAAEIRVLPLPAAADFRVAINDEQAVELRAQIEVDVQRTAQDAMADTYRRLLSVTQRAAERLGDPEAVFRDSLVCNIRECIALLPRLNLLQDAQLDELAAEVLREVAQYSGYAIREDDSLRSVVATSAREIAAKIKRAMSAYTQEKHNA